MRRCLGHYRRLRPVHVLPDLDRVLRAVVKQSLSWMGDINIVKIRGRDVAYIWGINNISVGIFGIPRRSSPC